MAMIRPSAEQERPHRKVRHGSDEAEKFQEDMQEKGRIEEGTTAALKAARAAASPGKVIDIAGVQKRSRRRTTKLRGR
ncbi:hypothetical protein M5K25_008824 [Dendrobium thyrsiflorum]|uniref:Uncharacterized protein n=1 Tax=Dendrobium thyrsiflorum TaxID=117978 RepID=A0ABD0V9X7_DENTH